MNPRVLKIGRNILFLLSIPGIVGAFIFANTNKQDEKLHGIHIDIENTELSFVTTDNILSLMESNHVRIHQSIVSDLKITSLENKIKKNKWVKDAEIYVTANHDLNIKITQRIPKVRISENEGSENSYYLDAQANPIELSEQYIARVPIVTTSQLDYSANDMKLKTDLVTLANYILADPFWNTMIEQINVNNQHQIELIPTLGSHLILIGNAGDLDSKMKRLLAFYQNGLTTIDWNRYNEIDVRYARQIVARNTNVKELINKTIEEAKIQMLKDQKEKYLLALKTNSEKRNTRVSDLKADLKKQH